MITIENVNNKLEDIIENSPFDENDKIIVLSNDLFVSVFIFVTLFGAANDMTSDSLLAVDNGVLGYRNYILEWKNKGYI